MKIGLFSDSLAAMPFPELLRFSAETGIEALELGCGNWSSAPHVDLDRLLASAPARRELLAAVADHGLALAALNCSGNPLHPGERGRQHDGVTRRTMRLAGLLGVPRVVMMSGLPGGAPGDTTANWVVTSWPPETREVLDYQWGQVLVPYWRELVREAAAAGVEKICLELHGTQCVYNAETLHRLRDAVGSAVGANLDPSHLMWMGGDPLLAIRALGEAIYWVHAKDTLIEPAVAGPQGFLDTKSADRLAERAWRYVTLGVGHGKDWWRRFGAGLEASGYDGVLSIEHEDAALTPEEGVRRSVRLLQGAIAR
jgi:sugar phosphate isomerase/epimerase